MWVTLHALTLIFLPVVTIAAICLSPARPRLGTVFAASLVGAFMVVIIGPTFTTCCEEPLQWRQITIPTACAAFAIVFISNRRASSGITFMSLALAFVLAEHAHRLRGLNQWTGMPNLSSLSAGRAKNRLKEIGSRLVELKDTAKYAPCWLRDHPNERIAIEGMVMPPRDSRAEPSWHTWLTGLYRRYDIDRDFWYPGGTLPEAAERLELRARPNLLEALERQHAALQREQNRIAKLHRDDRALANESVLAANLLGEYAWVHGGRLPESWQQLIESGMAGSAADGAIFVRQSGATILNPSRFRWTASAIVAPLNAAPQASATTSAADRLIWTTDNTLNADQLEGLAYRIQWIRTNGRIGQ